LKDAVEWEGYHIEDKSYIRIVSGNSGYYGKIEAILEDENGIIALALVVPESIHHETGDIPFFEQTSISIKLKERIIRVIPLEKLMYPVRILKWSESRYLVLHHNQN
jgi:ribosomal 30S subunit maturation factor RimM